MKLIDVAVFHENRVAVRGAASMDMYGNEWLPVTIYRFVCRGDNCGACSFKFKCYTERDILEVHMATKSSEPVSAWLNKRTRSTIYREGTQKFRKYASDSYWGNFAFRQEVLSDSS